MIETTGDPSATLTGWLKDYVDATAGTRFPPSFNTLVGIFALSAVVGRKACVRRNGFRLFPPTSIILLGHSGVGKSKSLSIGKTVVAMAAEDRPGFFISTAASFTMRGLMENWRTLQDKDDVGVLEGIVTVNEASAILTSKTGTETMAQWLIELLEHEDIEDFTSSKGHSLIKNVTVALGLCSTVDYLRKAISVDQFAGGLMHRFLVAHEVRRPDIEESPPPLETLSALATELRSIRDRVGEYMSISRDAEDMLRRIGRLAEKKDMRTVYLSGFWNRFSAVVAKVACVFALSDGEDEIAKGHVERAEILLRNFLYGPLEALVLEMSFGPRQQALFQRADELFYCGESGMLRSDFEKRLPSTSARASSEMMLFLETTGMLFFGKDRKKVYRLQKWVS